MSLLLRYGVLLSATMVAVGGGLYLYRHGYNATEYFAFRRQLYSARELGTALRFRWNLRGAGRGLILAGLWLLLYLQMFRLGLTAWLFARRRDRIFAGLTLAVLGLLLFSVSLNYV